MRQWGLRADLHIHTRYSDGAARPEEVLARAAELGLGAVSITDHDTFEGSVRAARAATSFGVVVVPGAEVRTNLGDVLVYCPQPIEIRRDVRELIELAHASGCVVAAAHPFDLLRLGVGDALYEINGWDAIEVWNAGASARSNRRALEAARALGLPGIAGSDAHILDHVGAAYTLILDPCDDAECVIDAIRRGRVRPVPGHYRPGTMPKRILWSIEYRVRRALRGASPDSL
ncbi:MAG: PHP domain-containing protein [Desulfurococcaceae archaeon]